MAVSFRSSRSLLLATSLFLCAGVAAHAADSPRAIVRKVPPTYPELARRMHLGGTVVLLVTVQPDGAVSSTKVESGHPLLASAAEDAVRRWHFAPAPGASESEIAVNFKSDQQ